MSKGSLARAGAAALTDKKKSDAAISLANKATSKRSSFMDGIKSRIEAPKLPVPVPVKKKEVVLSARDKLLMELNIPKVGGHSLTDVNRNDPAILAIIMPRKSKAHTRVVPEVS